MNFSPQAVGATTAVTAVPSQRSPSTSWQTRSVQARATVHGLLTAARSLDEEFLNVEHTLRLTDIALRLLQGAELIAIDRTSTEKHAFEIMSLIVAALSIPGETISPARRALLESAHQVLDRLTDAMLGCDALSTFTQQVH